MAQEPERAAVLLSRLIKAFQVSTRAALPLAASEPAICVPEDVFMKVSLLLFPEMASRPTDTVNIIAERCTKAPKQMGELLYLIFQ